MSSPPAAEREHPAEPWRTRHPAYRQPLAPDVALTLMRIPAGSFLMGAPEEEEGSRLNQRGRIGWRSGNS